MLLDDVLAYNKKFVEDEQYKAYETDVIPNKRAVIFTCMDTRLVELLPKALNIKNGDVKMVKNAGAILRDPYDSVMKSLIVATYALEADEIFVIGHHKCGMTGFNREKLEGLLSKRDMPKETLNQLEANGINVEDWIKGFDKVEDSVKNSVEVIRNHPMLPPSIPVHGLVIDPETGGLDLVENGY
ncbi:beta-class carbonic anhydrase [Aquibacillus salsiterrae]|uniref:carbonic anhydrase n=1 Tax=Aquibacillus salsiterrae TaxID=2950439 RepID=A0A9X3WFW0_9BACI|nr:carbonic anhydrase [Aquibacillus salsiterrae]MDC3417681.1 carbonic anhydrase [Aquibacillus salsiterrae]